MTAEPAPLIAEAESHVRSLFESDSGGHDWWHLVRVRRLAEHIAQREGGDLTVIVLAALLHDVNDWKFADGDLEAGPQAVREWLVDHDGEAALADAVASIVAEVSFKGAGVATIPATLEGRIVQDADRLDAIGAIGIARAFAYGGSRGRPLHDPAVAPSLHRSFEEYRSSTGATLNHFYEKLLLLKERLHTETARRIASERHAFMSRFVDQFLDEWTAADLPEGIIEQ